MNGHSSYEMAKLRMADDHRWAANERLAREAREAREGQRQATRIGGPAPAGIVFSLKRLITHLSWT
jgi:hypothetical protein